MSLQTDRRREPRLALVCEVMYEVEGVRFKRHSADLSAGGMFIDDRLPPHEGSLVRVAFPIEGRTFQARGRVVYSQAPYGFGVTFTEMGEEQREFLRRYVAHKSGVVVAV